MVSLSDFAGKKVVLYFYPKNNTPGCTRQACAVGFWLFNGCRRLSVMPVRNVSFKTSDSYGFALFAADALAFALGFLRTDSSAYGRKRT